MDLLHRRWEKANDLTETQLKQLQNDLIKAGLVSQEEIYTKWEIIQK